VYRVLAGALQLELIVVNPTLVEAREIIASLSGASPHGLSALALVSLPRSPAVSPKDKASGGNHFALIQRTD
jgi:hypothetical protein